MFRRVPHWHWLTLFAAGNLVLWVVVAVVVGLVVSDAVDIGVETFIREHQATAVAVWKQASIKTSSATAKPAIPTPTIPASPQPTRAKAQVQKSVGVILQPGAATPSPAVQTRATQGAAEPVKPPPHPTAQSTPRPTEVAVSTPLLMSDPGLNSLMRMDAEMNQSAVGRAVQIRYQEAALNREIAALLRQYPDLPYRNVQVQLRRDQAAVVGEVTVLGIRLGAEVRGKVIAQNCLPQVEIEAISIAGVPAPGFVADQIEEMILETTSWYPANYPLCLEQIVLEEGRVTVYGSRR